MKVLLNILTHGTETVGIAVAKEIRKLKIVNGELIVHRANELAYKKRKRFIDQDLNRSFPGDIKGNHEQKLASKILPLVTSADVVIDIHSTKSGLKDALIVTKLDAKTRDCISAISPKYVLHMNATKHTALISTAKIGIAFEYGKNNDAQALKKVVSAITRLLVYLTMVEKRVSHKESATTWFDVYKTIPKPKGAKLLPAIKNYKLVRKGTVFAHHKNNPITATDDFYPILFGETNYKDIFGFAARLKK